MSLLNNRCYCAENGKSNARHRALYFSFQFHSSSLCNLDDITGHDLKEEHCTVPLTVTHTEVFLSS
jgi:hypothetical protein